MSSSIVVHRWERLIFTLDNPVNEGNVAPGGMVILNDEQISPLDNKILKAPVDGIVEVLEQRFK